MALERKGAFASLSSSRLFCPAPVAAAAATSSCAAVESASASASLDSVLPPASFVSGRPSAALEQPQSSQSSMPHQAAVPADAAPVGLPSTSILDH